MARQQISPGWVPTFLTSAAAPTERISFYYQKNIESRPKILVKNRNLAKKIGRFSINFWTVLPKIFWPFYQILGQKTIQLFSSSSERKPFPWIQRILKTINYFISLLLENFNSFYAKNTMETCTVAINFQYHYYVCFLPFCVCIFHLSKNVIDGRFFYCNWIQ